MKLVDSEREQLLGECANDKGFLVVSYETNGERNSIRTDAPVAWVSLEGDEGLSEWIVSNEYPMQKNIQVMVYQPNYSIQESILMEPGQQRDFAFYSEAGLDANFSMPSYRMSDHYDLCDSSGGCLHIDYFDVHSGKWLSTGSNAGAGVGLYPDEDGYLKFRVTNRYPMSIDALVTLADKYPEGCSYIW